MKRFFFLLSLLISFSIGQIWAAADVTYDFTGTDWTVSNGTLSNGTVSFTGAGSASKGSFKMNSGYFMLGKKDAYLTFPTYSSAVEKIVVTGKSGASASTKMNIYVETTAVSTETVGSTGTNTYEIASASQAAGTTYTLRVTSDHNAQITKIEIYYAEEVPAGTCATPIFSLDEGTYEGAQSVTISCSTTDATIYYTTDGSTPTTSSSVYSAAIPVAADMTIKAYAVKDGSNDSEVATAAYTITEGPDVTLNLLDEGWGFPTSKVVDETSYTNGDYTIKVAGTTGNGFRTYGTYFMLGQNGAYIELPTFTNPIEKIVVTGNSGGSSKVTWNIFKKGENSDAAVSTAVTGCTNDAYTFNIDPVEANVVYRLKVTSAANLQIKAIKIYYGAAPDVATPTISGEQNFTTSTTVTLNCTTDDASIYYTTDGTTPSNTSTAYSAPFTLNSSATVKAIAIKGGKSSSVAEKAFTKLDLLTTMDAIFTKATAVGNTATDVYITFNNWVVTGVKGSNAYVTDGTKGLIIYQSSHGFAVGNILSGTAACKVQLYNGSSEITSLTKSTTGLTVTTGGTVTPVELDASGIAALTGVNTGSVIKISGACTTNNSKYYVAGVQLYNSLYEYDADAPTAGKDYNCTGVYLYYKNGNNAAINEILPRSAADIEEIAEEGAPEAPTFSPAAGTYTSVQSVEISSATQGATIYYTTDGTTPTSASTEYTAAVSVGETMTIKAIAIKNSIESTVATAAYTINLPEDESTQKTWNLAIDETASASANELTWSATYVGMSYSKGTSTTNANNYYPGTSGQSYTSTRFYKNGVLTITPAEGKQITTVMFKATTSGYASALASSAWGENASAAVNSADATIVDVTASGQGAISATIGATCGFTQVLIQYTDVDESVPANPTFSPAAGSYTSAQNVEISCTTQGATIYYTTDGTTPTSASTQYLSAISVSESMTIKAIAIKESKSSSVVSAAYTINIDSRSIATGSSFAEVSGNLSPAVIAYAAYKGDGTSDPAINNSNIRIYKPASGKSTGGYLTLTAVSGCTIDQVKITFAGNATAAYCINDAALPTTQYIDGETELLTPAELNAQSVSIVNLKNGSIDVKEIVVYYTGEAVTLQSLAISGTASVLEYNEGQNFNPAGLVVTGHYSDNSDAVISEGITWAYDPSPLTQGTTSVSVTATVSEITSSTFVVNGLTVGAAGTTYRKVTATEDITDGQYLIVYEATSVAFNGALETLDAEGNSVAVEISAGVIAGSSAIDAAVFTIDATAGTLQSASGKYIGVSSNSNGLKQTDDASTYTHTFSIDEDGNAVILANFESSTMKLRYNPSTSAGNLRFRYYKNDGQQPIQLYKKEAQPVTKYTVTYAAGGGSGDAPAPVEYEEGETFTVAEADLFTAPEGKEFDTWNDGTNDYAPGATYTVGTADVVLTAKWKDAPQPEELRPNLEQGRLYSACMTRNIIGVQGGILWDISHYEGTKVYFEEIVVSPSTPLTAGRPFILMVTGDFKVSYSGDEISVLPAPSGNSALRGTFSDMDQAAFNTVSWENNDSPIYMLYNNQLRQVADYTHTNLCTGNSLAANRAYLLYSALIEGQPNLAPGRRVMTMSVEENVATDINFSNGETINASKIIRNGQILILRDGKTFDVTGRELK